MLIRNAAAVALAIAIALTAAGCQIDDWIGAVAVDTAPPTYTPFPTIAPPANYEQVKARRDGEAESTPLAVLPALTPTPTPTLTPTLTPQPAQEATATANRLASDDLRRCDHWALTTLPPIVYSRFETLNPSTMPDLDRALWKATLERYADGAEMALCRDYYSEPLSASNAAKRNEFWRSECYRDMYNRAERVNNQYGHAIFAGNAPRNAINQFARVMNWMDIPAETLADMDEPPLSLLQRIAATEAGYYLTSSGGNGDYPHTSEVSDEQLEWFGLAYAFASSACHKFYPQLFVGRWIPDDFGNGRITPTAIPQDTFGYDTPNRSLFVPDAYIDKHR